MMLRKILIAFLLLALGGAIGYFARPRQAPEKATPSLALPSNAESVDALLDSFAKELTLAPPKELGAKLLAHRDDPLVYRFVATRWASTDPLGLFAFIETLDWSAEENVRLLENLFTILYREWGRANPEAAFAHAFEHPWAKRGRRYFGLERLVEVVAETDLDKAIGMILKAPNRVIRFERGPWMTEAPKILLPKIARLPEGNSWRQQAFLLLYRDWAAEDPKAALSYYLEQPYGDAFHENGIAMASSVIGENPEAALSWAAEQKNPAIQLVVQAAINAAASSP